MKVIFLDIDGVLNSYKFSKTLENHENLFYGMEIDPFSLELFTNLLKNNASIKVVISSSWRDSLSLYQFKELFKSFQDQIIDMTSSDVDKAKSIELWVKTHKINEFVILDDDVLFDLDHGFNKKQIKTSPNLGISHEHINQIKILLHL